MSHMRREATRKYRIIGGFIGHYRGQEDYGGGVKYKESTRHDVEVEHHSYHKRLQHSIAWLPAPTRAATTGSAPAVESTLASA
ncbi:MAG: hypothetical protein IVW57_19835, partial [Ktedonobacterales bacterium]|nr:hypothetical protein [Ktedonobacterales bacterium]